MFEMIQELMEGDTLTGIQRRAQRKGNLIPGEGSSPFRVVPTAAEGFTAMSSHLRQAHSSLSIKLTPASDLTVWRRYLNGTQL